MLRNIGRDLQRPECILAERDGTLWSADARGGVMRIAPDGSQQLICQEADGHFNLSGDAKSSLVSGTLPNGLAFGPDGTILVSNFGKDRLEAMDRHTGTTRILHDTIDGKPMGKVNFVLRDRKGRIWLTVSTMVNPWTDAITPSIRDGYIALIDDRGIRVVAEGFAFTNELRLDAAEEWLYVAETTGKCITRMRVGNDGSLSDRETYGPASLGTGAIDGICFDAYGNLWATMIFADRLVAITPEGDVLELADFGNAAATDRFEAEFASGASVSFETLSACGGTVAPWLASMTFAGADLRTVCLGSLRGTTIPTFTAPVAGLPMAHW
ncbi:SMP-30/gluconolactonase/LRE family protein [Novosphingobium sp. SG707]|uniref:SMP-30/gluconolactonase/LRE family protein n=1 Tax=Novosphingobium sp. SG707 TaxID=2586996 RepID=UPI00155285B7|nr:SMP-30/gluconolactonase/LRE family protein [Novosphingobium sp. SG707]NKJ00937.1 sugar lactone lactonase YvrE [Novosphingobium sp. SG707]